MTMEELTQLSKEGKITQEDMFKHFGVRNIEGLEMAIEEKSKDVQPRIEYMNSTFAFIYGAREDEDYNPVTEKFFYFTTVIPALYPFEPEEINALAKAFGVYQIIMMLDRIFKDKPEIIYYNGLLQNYINNKENLSRVVEKGIKDFVKFLDDKLKDLTLQDIENLGNKVMGEVAKLRQKV